MLALAATLPLMVAMVKRPALYNGIRHFLFVIPPMAVVAGVGFAWIMTASNARRRAGGRRRHGVRGGAAAAAHRNGPAASLSVHLLQSRGRNGSRRRRALHARLLGARAEAGVRGLREQLEERQEVPPANRKWKVAVCGPQQPARVALGDEFSIGWDSRAPTSP